MKWAERAVRESISSTETEALKDSVIDPEKAVVEVEDYLYATSQLSHQLHQGKLNLGYKVQTKSHKFQAKAKYKQCWDHLSMQEDVRANSSLQTLH